MVDSDKHRNHTLKLEHQNFVYPGAPTWVMKDFTFQPNPQGISVILGGSGCGKTTLLHQLAKTSLVSMMFQEPRLLPWYTVRKNLELVLESQILTSGQGHKELIPELLDQVGLVGLEDRYPNQLSGGQKQRVSMARAFGFESQALLMDEPFQGLDVMLRQDLIQLVVDLWTVRKATKPRPIVAVIHEPRDAAILATDIYVFSGPPLQEVARIAGHPKGPGIQDHKTLEIEEEILRAMVEAKNFQSQ